MIYAQKFFLTFKRKQYVYDDILRGTLGKYMRVDFNDEHDMDKVPDEDFRRISDIMAFLREQATTKGSVLHQQLLHIDIVEKLN